MVSGLTVASGARESAGRVGPVHCQASSLYGLSTPRPHLSITRLAFQLARSLTLTYEFEAGPHIVAAGGLTHVEMKAFMTSVVVRGARASLSGSGADEASWCSLISRLMMVGRKVSFIMDVVVNIFGSALDVSV